MQSLFQQQPQFTTTTTINGSITTTSSMNNSSNSLFEEEEEGSFLMMDHQQGYCLHPSTTTTASSTNCSSFQHLPAQYYVLPKITTPLTVVPNRGKANKRDNYFANDEPEGEAVIIVNKENDQDNFIEEGQEKKFKSNNYYKNLNLNSQQSSFTTTVSSSDISSPNCFFPTLYSCCNTNDWFYNFNMLQCIKSFEKYVDDLNDINNIQMSNIDFIQFCNDYRYFNNNFNNVRMTGLLRLFMDLGFKSFYDYRYFIFVFLFNFQSKLTISRSEWLFGMFNLQCDTIEKLRMKITQVETESYSWNAEQMKNFFAVVFRILRDSEKSRSIDVNTAATALQVLMSNRSHFTERFCNFLISTSNPTHKCLNLDQWKIFVDFSASIRSDFGNYDSNDAWPSLYDDFKDWVCSEDGRMSE
ncbi:hypothetical protein ABK040_001472 [Willaertia magna]